MAALSNKLYRNSTTCSVSGAICPQGFQSSLGIIHPRDWNNGDGLWQKASGKTVGIGQIPKGLIKERIVPPSYRGEIKKESTLTEWLSMSTQIILLPKEPGSRIGVLKRGSSE